ncbi:MAG: twin arginine-targeting protein translocase TatC [Candidatus Fischerbacteria bacterium RBG_13_37_8]|uniref:Sec-independent protein translocase protein TatC n=1 Tax=Candidatus Fischerbacteria bacterium RBG_13_37_8 TaxID=1817863 RepID=A0A1F5V8W7_9BACT|nr:MAG: twin arginine-targeting protein translocase TatC [Candidatus Fischerbacteria bacterium RBG_13_37_8]
MKNLVHDNNEIKNENFGIASMSFLEHLDELRKRLFYSLISIFFTFILCWIFSKKIFSLIVAPAIKYLHQDGQLSFFTIPEPFMLYMKVAFLSALFLASPFVLSQLWLFISPGLYQKEKIYAIPFIFFTTFFFIAGGAFGYLVIFPLTCKFLLSYGEGFNAVIRISDYFSFFSKVLLGVGLIFEMPVLAFFLAKIGVLHYKFLIKNLKYAILIIFIISAIITPSTDAITQTVLAIPMIILYLISIFIVWLVAR